MKISALFFLVVFENTSAKPLLLSRRVMDGLHFEVTDEHGKVTQVEAHPAGTAFRAGVRAAGAWECTTMEIYYVVPLLKSGEDDAIVAGGRDLPEQGPLDGKYPFPFLRAAGPAAGDGAGDSRRQGRR